MLDKRQIEAIFLLKFKMGHKAVETICYINHALGPGTANEHTVQWWFKKFCKEDESLGIEERNGQSLEADNDQLRAIVEADPFNTRSWQRTQHQPFYGHSGFEANWKGE